MDHGELATTTHRRYSPPVPCWPGHPSLATGKKKPQINKSKLLLLFFLFSIFFIYIIFYFFEKRDISFSLPQGRRNRD